MWPIDVAMRKILRIVSVLLLTMSCTSHETNQEMVERVFKVAAGQVRLLNQMLADGECPRSLNDDGSLMTSSIWWWCSGFYPGTAWLVYEYTQDEQIRDIAWKHTVKLDSIRFRTNDHDVGFQLNCSYGNALRLTGDEKCREVLFDGAHSFATRFNPIIGCTRSWDYDGRPWDFPVIIDNMMNLELLLKVANMYDDNDLCSIAKSHADVTMKNHFREDHSTYHVVNYDPETGDVAFKGTFQGLSDDSSWSRGQGWGLYGYTVMYRFTNDPVYLKKAQDIARYIMSYKPMPEDKIFLWDYKAPSDSPRDASAAALCASALLELSLYADDKVLADESFDYAVQILKSLSGPEYTAAKGQNGGFLLMHSVTSYPADKEIDKPLCYADYYYLEALLRLKNILDNDKR